MDFNQALAILSFELQRVGTVDAMDSMMKKVSGMVVSETDKSIYATLAEMAELARSPRGSLLTFNAERSRLSGQFTRDMALAQLEQ